MERQRAKVITEYDHLFGIRVELLLLWTVRLFSIEACRDLKSSQDTRAARITQRSGEG